MHFPELDTCQMVIRDMCCLQALSERCRASVDTQRPSFSEIVGALRDMQSGPDLQQTIQPFSVLALSNFPP